MSLDFAPQRSTFVLLLIAALAVNLMLHIPSFYRTSFKGDENVYQVLAHSMDWNLSNYTTANNPSIARWGNTIYQKPVFHHGPLLPLVIKTGLIFGQPTAAALLFANIAMAMFFAHLLILYRRLSIPPPWQILGVFAAAFAPLLLFSTTRIHNDAVSGIFLVCAIISFIEALERQSTPWSIFSGILLAAALNLRFSAIIGLPLIVFCQFFYLYKLKAEQSADLTKKQFHKLRNWKAFLILSIVVVTLGLQHFYRLYAAYGSIFPWDFMQSDPSSSWVQFIATRTRAVNFVNLVLLVPLLFLFLFPHTWKAVWRGFVEKDWAALLVVLTVYLFATLLAFSHQELRFFAAATPFAYCCVPWILTKSKPGMMPYYLALIAVSLALMLAAGYREVVGRPDEVFRIVPVIYELIPPLQKYW